MIFEEIYKNHLERGISVYCENCGRELPDEAKFCPECGKNVLHDVSDNISGKNVPENKPAGKKKNSRLSNEKIIGLVVCSVAVVTAVALLMIFGPFSSRKTFGVPSGGTVESGQEDKNIGAEGNSGGSSQNADSDSQGDSAVYEKTLVAEALSNSGGTGASDSSYVGESMSAGLYRMPDGSFETSDGRLNAAVGKAMFLSDKNGLIYSAEYVLDLDSNRHQFYVKNKSGIIQLNFYFPAATTLSTGNIFAEDYFIIDRDYAQHDDFQKQDNIPSYTWSSMFAMLHDNGYVIPIRSMSGEMKRLNLRVMYWEEDVAAVIYACAKFDTAPYEVEMLIAVSLGEGSVVSDKADGEFTVRPGGNLEITGPSEFGAKYELWSWEIVDGSGLASVSGANSRTVTVTAGKSTGDIRIQMIYEYGVEEPDVLTGNPRTVGRTKTEEYTVHIVSG